MKKTTSMLAALVVLFSIFGPALTTSASSATIPTFSIVSVVTDTSVTIKTNNFPAHQTFTVRMGAFGTRGIGGTVVTTTDSGAGGSFVATYTIPASLKGSAQIAIRMDSPSGYYAYNWFTNSTSGTPSSTGTPSGYSGYPYFYIDSVVKDTSVTIKAYNFPAHDTFTVRMGAYGTLGVSGTVVGTTDSGAGGSFTATYNIPSGLKGDYRIAIRLDGGVTKYFAFNWFFNNTSPASTSTPGPTPTPGPTSTPAPGYSGFPSFSIVSVVKDTSVTIKTKNFPAHDSFKVTMGAFGTLGVGGTVVATTDSGTGGAFTVTYTIPASLKGSARIAIRLQSPTTGYFAYNWFYNNSTP